MKIDKGMIAIFVFLLFIICVQAAQIHIVSGRCICYPSYYRLPQEIRLSDSIHEKNVSCNCTIGIECKDNKVMYEQLLKANWNYSETGFLCD